MIKTTWRLWTVIVTILLCGAVPGAETTQRQIVLNAMQQRPKDPWPRGTGHVVLALPGSREVDKAYHEPGGSFSPSVGSFGVSVWVTDSGGVIKSTSDSLPLDQCHQQWSWPSATGLPALLTDTPYYQTAWSYAGPDRWQLQLRVKTNENTRLQLVIRSVGPAGGPILSLAWNGQSLVINERWALTCEPLPGAVHLGHEGAPDWTAVSNTNRVWRTVDGWAFARLELPSPLARRFLIQDATPAPASGLVFSSTRSPLDVRLPDPQFAACLNAQVANILMGLVGRQTRPGDPTHYPLNWLNGGAYIVAALAQAGQLEAARQLCMPFAETDFFGGDGPEADNPGLALWALEEVAGRLGQRQYDQLLWPHVIRKASLLMQMRSTFWPIFRPVVGPVLPQYATRPDLTLVCEAARNGLIVGKVDWERPLLYVNAVSYLGLVSAAEIAERVGDVTLAVLWRAQAAELRQAWTPVFESSSAAEDRLFTCGLWPSWIVADPATYSQRLSTRWDQEHDKQGRLQTTLSRTYIEAAETHQWLDVRRPEYVWDNLQWFWDHQASPGLYTWWEGAGEEVTFRLWERIRGWVKPPHVTPQYVTAAQILLLQLSMLASVDESGSVPVLTVGAGITPGWLDKPMHVRGLLTRIGWVDWNWSGGSMQVVVRGRRCPVRLGPAFAANTPLVVRYQ
jgi:hypothetical protein